MRNKLNLTRLRLRGALLVLAVALLGVAACQTRYNDQAPANKKDAETATNDRRQDMRKRQYISQGKQLYNQKCAQCHNEAGTGLAKLYPPLKNADYMLADVNRTICGIKYGQKGPIEVNGVAFNGVMPGNPGLTDIEIAEITTYIYNAFGGQDTLYDVRQVQAALKACKK